MARIPMPPGYQDAKAQSNAFDKARKLPSGAYHVVIKNAKVKFEKATVDKKDDQIQKLIIDFDISKGEYKDFYAEKFQRERQYALRNNKDPQKITWKGTYKQNISLESNPNDTRYAGFFKGFTQTLEACNPGYKFGFDEAELIGKALGMTFEESEFTNDEGRKVKFTAVRNPIQLSEIDAYNAKLNSKQPTENSIEESAVDDMVDKSSNVDDIEIPF